MNYFRIFLAFLLNVAFWMGAHYFYPEHFLSLVIGITAVFGVTLFLNWLDNYLYIRSLEKAARNLIEAEREFHINS